MLLFCGLIANSDQSKIQMASFRDVGEPPQCNQLLSIVSYDIDCIVLKFQWSFELVQFLSYFCQLLAYFQ